MGLDLASFSHSGPISRLLYLLQRLRHFFVEYMCIARGGFDVGVVERLLHELEIASVAEEFCTDIMPNVVEAEILKTCLGPKTTPVRFRAARSEGVAVTLRAPCTGSLR